MRGLRLAIATLFTPIALGLALACAGGAAASHLGRWDARFDLAAQFAPFWLAGGLAAVLLSFLLPKGVRGFTAFVAVVAVGGAAWLMAPEFLRDAGPKAAVDAPGQIKVIQWNARGRIDDAALEWLVAEDPDFVLGEEFTPAFRDALLARTGWNVVSKTAALLVMSKHKPEEMIGQPFGHIKGMTTRDERGAYAVIAVDYQRPSLREPDIQESRERELLAHLEEIGDTSRTIVAGDMNSSSWTFQRNRWDQQFPVIRRDRGLFTWPARPYERFRWAPFPFFAISHVYAGPGWATVSVKRGPKLDSDHYPVVAVLAPVS